MNVVWTYVSPTRQGGPARPKGKAARVSAETSLPHLVDIFLAWKCILLVVALASPGPGYDTSTQILLDQDASSTSPSFLSSVVQYVALRLTRWDGIYFATSSTRGHVYEQEWAFSWVLARVTHALSTVLFWPFSMSPIVKHALAGAVISNLSHFAAVLTLYYLVREITPSTPSRKRQLAFTTACLHIFSPAGIFLSSPNGESPFALWNFAGFYCYAQATQARFREQRYSDVQEFWWTLAAGASFGGACMMRSNGLLSGILFAWDVLEMLPRWQSILYNPPDRTRFLTTIAAGSLTGLGFALPQVVAYTRYCTGDIIRPWCTNLPPSIYSFVQSHYWDVGFLRYWKVSNIPLFALTFPVGWLMVETAVPALFQAHHINRVVNASTLADQRLQPYPPMPHSVDERIFEHLLPRLALPQVVLVVLAATSFHCQILNRISSGYPLWYLVVANEICLDGFEDGEKLTGKKQGLFRLLGNYDRIPSTSPEWVVRGFVLYALVQAGLYASFLPPA